MWVDFHFRTRVKLCQASVPTPCLQPNEIGLLGLLKTTTVHSLILCIGANSGHNSFQQIQHPLM
ncbi:MAG: hypothetical protein Q7U37_09470, partial [Gallionella sp.]|nr:hypothetical protein [Gallionella sp.]